MASARLQIVAAALALAAISSAAWAAQPERIVSLNPSLTAILVALGARDRLVGVDEFSAREQPEVAGLPRVGGLYDPSLEAVVALHPDLVVLVPSAEQRDFQARLGEIGLPVASFDPVSFADVLATIAALGERVGSAEAARARVDEIERVRDEVMAAARSRSRVRAVLVLQREPLFVAGRGSFIDDMLRAVGSENLAAVFPEPYPRASLEWLVAAAPDVILDASGASEPPARYWARWASLPAVRSGRTVAVRPGLVTLPGPHLDAALRALASAVGSPGP